MTTTNPCPFCDTATLQHRLIREEPLYISIISDPSFRQGQCLVIPRRHITTPGELTRDEAAEILLELGRLSTLLDEGYGTGIMQKYQPAQAENGIKVNHLHFHVFPRVEQEAGLFPVPEPNDFSGFRAAPEAQVARLLQALRQT
jgi:diadenosine tetraphosphate (Ap4A) HIT family hydrolase